MTELPADTFANISPRLASIAWQDLVVGKYTGIEGMAATRANTWRTPIKDVIMSNLIILEEARIVVMAVSSLIQKAEVYK